MKLIVGEPRPALEPGVIIVPFRREGSLAWHDCKIVRRAARQDGYLRSLITFMRWICQ